MREPACKRAIKRSWPFLRLGVARQGSVAGALGSLPTLATRVAKSAQEKPMDSPLRVLAVLAGGCCIAACAIPARTEEPSSDIADQVTVGIYVNAVTNVSLRDGTATVDFWLWCRWRKPEYAPLESLEVVNGAISSRTSETTKELPGGEQYACCRVIADLRQKWSVHAFPLDTQTLTIQIEDAENEAHLVRVIPDSANTKIDPAACIPGWNIDGCNVHVAEHEYLSNYGDTSLPTDEASSYSSLIFSMKLVRPGWGLFVKLFAGVAVATGIAFLSLLIRPVDLDPRFGLAVGGIFAAVASQYVLASALPDTTEITMADQLCMCSMAFIFIALIESVVSLKLYYMEKVRMSRLLDIYSCVVFTLSYVLLCTGFVYQALVPHAN